MVRRVHRSRARRRRHRTARHAKQRPTVRPRLGHHRLAVLPGRGLVLGIGGPRPRRGPHDRAVRRRDRGPNVRPGLYDTWGNTLFGLMLIVRTLIVWALIV